MEQHGLDVSRETLTRLEIYVDLLLKWNSKINLISRSTIDQIWHRHIADSLQLVDLAPDGCLVWADFGSGGGLPGLVAAIAMEGRQARPRFHLVESDQRKAAFLREAIRLLRIDVSVHAARIETLGTLSADVVTARALAPLKDLCGYASKHLLPGGTALFLKGENWSEEVADAKSSWRFSFVAHESKTAARATIVELRDIEHA